MHIVRLFSNSFCKEKIFAETASNIWKSDTILLQNLTIEQTCSYSSYELSFFIFQPHWKTALYYFPVMSRVVCLESFVIYKSINYPWN